MVFDLVRRESWIALLDSGMSQGEACERVRVSPGTIGKWLRRGRLETKGDYFEFAAAVDKIRPRPRRKTPNSLVVQERQGGLDVGQLVSLLEEQALNGNVQAIKHLLDRPWERRDAEEEGKSKAPSILDELSAFRERKAPA